MIKHPATIVHIEQDKILINVENTSSCVNCHSKNHCIMNECKNKIIEIKAPSEHKYHFGDKVTMSLDENLGWLAVVYSYILPLTLVIISLIITYQITKSEEVSAIFGLIALIPYYFLLFMLKKYFSKKFNFKIDK